ncbi:nagb/rpia/CoA transferase-like protein [Nadsonia fulvescens var. elongata DSM 6958]|uniref:Nagb/rpia/CoA transferase-like protein n=1 Tax=Nadsonia fulvescens var. elongata DSM 6958 TaxID=857566 RepID=A0A1E3PFB7_9ASCO|nr:nagb/rpia/CoA transferase-like protein [Nadsonia fulvescens var. elongata DSM 6958]
MTTTVPAIFAFPEFAGVAAAVADHIIAAQNATLSPSGINLNHASPSAIGLNGLIDSSADNSAANSAANSTVNSGHSSHVHLAPPSQASLTPAASATILSHQRTRSSSNSHSHSLSHNSSSNPNNPGLPAGSSSASSSKKFRIAVSGGSLIHVLHQGLLGRSDVQWGQWEVYFADERLVPFSDPDSNFGLFKRQILDYLPPNSPRPVVFHIKESLIDDASACADHYEKLLIKGFAAKDSVKLPIFDLLLLGCAPDGHVCSLFPNHALLREDLAWVAPVEDAPHGPKRRITLTIPVVCHAHRVTFVVEGATKAPVLKTIMERPDKGLPASIVNEAAAGKVAWFVDDDALLDVFVTKKKYKMLVV